MVDIKIFNGTILSIRKDIAAFVESTRQWAMPLKIISITQSQSQQEDGQVILTVIMAYE